MGEPTGVQCDLYTELIFISYYRSVAKNTANNYGQAREMIRVIKQEKCTGCLVKVNLI
jgi:hypothetical protein